MKEEFASDGRMRQITIYPFFFLKKRGYNKPLYCNFIFSDLNVIETVLIKRHRLVVYPRKLWMCLSNKCLKVSEFNIILR